MAALRPPIGWKGPSRPLIGREEQQGQGLAGAQASWLTGEGAIQGRDDSQQGAGAADSDIVGN